MLAKEKRLRNTRDIAKVYSKGAYAGIGTISVKSLRTHLPHSRVVVVVGKKVSKKATVRNSIRRRIIPILRAEWQTVSPGYDIVITVHSELNGVTPKQLEADIKHLLKKAKLINV